VAGWLLVAVLGIIWVASLLPIGRLRGSAGSSVEEFERSMDLLAETHRRSTGRWVVMPRKGSRFSTPRDLGRARLRRRRRQILAGLAEATVLLLLIGLFPPLHAVLAGAVVLVCALLLYSAMLARVRAAESARAHAVAVRRARREAAGEPVEHGAPPPPATAPADAPAMVDDDVHVIVRHSEEVDVEELRVAAGAR